MSIEEPPSSICDSKICYAYASKNVTQDLKKARLKKGKKDKFALRKKKKITSCWFLSLDL